MPRYNARQRLLSRPPITFFGGDEKPSSDESTWEFSSRNEVSYLFYQGRDNTQAQAVKYTGNHPIRTTTNEVVYLNRPTIYNLPAHRLWVYPEIGEIHKGFPYAVINRAKQLWRRGIRHDKTGTYDASPPMYPCDEPGSVYHYRVDKSKASLGQVTDITAHYERYKALESAFQQGEFRAKALDVVVYGVSRGATTTFNALSAYPVDYKSVKLCVLEGPPATVSSVIKAKVGRRLGKFLYRHLGAFVFGDEHQVTREHQAIASVGKFPKHVPLVVVSSQKDEVVPHKNSLNLAWGVAAHRIELIDKGEDDIAPVYIIQLDEALHNDYTYGSDGARYQNILHAIYRKHGLPHVAAYANAGENEVSIIELTRGPLATQVIFQRSFKRLSGQPEARTQLRQEALEAFYGTLYNQHQKTDSPDEVKRLTQLGSAMSLYHKSLQGRGFFSKPEEPLVFQAEREVLKVK